VSSITLFDVEAQEFKTFRKRKENEVEIVDALYEPLLRAQAFAAFMGSPGARPEEQQKTDEEITDSFIKMAKETVESSPYSVDVRNQTTEVLKSQLLDLQNHIRNLNGRLDKIYSKYSAEGKTLQDANNDNKAKELRQLISAITRLANDRRSQIIDRKEKLELEVKTLNDKVESLQNEVNELTTNVEEVQKQIDNTREVLESGVYNPSQNADDAREIAKAQKFIEQGNLLISYLSKKIEDKTKQINQYKDEIDILLGRRKISSETTEAAAAGEISERENLRTGEASEDTGLDAVNTSHDKIVERQNGEIEGQNQASNGSNVDQAGGQVNTTNNPTMPSTGNATIDNSNAITIESGADLSLDIQLVKGEYAVNDDTYNVIAEVNADGTVTVRPRDTRRDSRIIVNESGQQVEVIEDNRKLLSNPALFPPGTEIVFEVREDTKFWQSDSEKAKASLPEDRHWEQVPIFVKAVTRKTDANGNEVVSTEYISLLSAYNPNSPDGYKGNARKLIYEAYKKGGRVTSTIKNKEFTTGAKGNIINLRTADGQVVFVNPVGEDGIGYKFVNGVPVQTTPTVAIAVGMETVDEEGNPTEVSRKFELGNTKGLTPEEISKMGDSLNTALSFYKELTDAGIAVFVIQDPRGNYRAIPAATRKLTKVAQKQALSALGKRDLVTFNEIVGTNKVRAVTENFLEVESVDKAWGATEDTPGIRVTFYSASAKSLVSVQYDKLLQAIAAQEQTGESQLDFSFTVIEQTPEGGKNFKSASRPKEEFGSLKPMMVSDFLNVMGNKRFQVDKALLQTNDPYVSKVTGNQYPSYTAYLFSDIEATEPRESGLGSNAILATNVANNNYGSAFFDIGLSFTDIKVDGVGVEIKEEMRARQFEEPVSAPPASTSSVTSGISLSLPPLPGMPPIQFNPSSAPAPAPTPAPEATTIPLNIATGKISPQRVQEITSDLNSGRTFPFDYQGEELDFVNSYLAQKKKLEERVGATPASDTTGMTPEQLGLETAPKTIRIKGVMYLANEVNADMLAKLGIRGEEANDILNSICN
jgi:predicted  nucleic acid-binding Zn-ribbon protein